MKGIKSMEGTKIPWVTYKISFCEVSALKINNTVEHDANSVLESFKDYYSTLAENL